MTRLVFSTLLVLAGCNTPSPGFYGVDATRVTVDDSVFDVRVRGEKAEAIRVNPQYAPRFGPIRARAAFAMAQVSGCAVVRVDGDQAVAIGVLSCDGRPPERGLLRGPLSYSCVEIGALLDQMPGGPYSEFDCDPY